MPRSTSGWVSAQRALTVVGHLWSPNQAEARICEDHDPVLGTLVWLAPSGGSAGLWVMLSHLTWNQARILPHTHTSFGGIDEFFDARLNRADVVSADDGAPGCGSYGDPAGLRALSGSNVTCAL